MDPLPPHDVQSMVSDKNQQKVKIDKNFEIIEPNLPESVPCSPNCEKFTDQEIKIFKESYKAHENDWNSISKTLPGRTPNFI